MKKFESTTTNLSSNQQTKGNNISKILQILPSLIEVLPKIMGRTQQPEQEQSNVSQEIYYPNSPTQQQFRATQIRNTMESIATHQYLVSTLKHNKTINGNSPLFQQTDTLPNTPRRQHYLDLGEAIDKTQ